MEFLRRNYVYLICFFVVFFLFLFLSPSMLFDATWEYGMAHAIVLGEVPYLDFNIITTPFYPFFHALFLAVYDSYFVYLCVNAGLFTFLFYLLYKWQAKRTVFYLGISCVFLFQLFIPSYNFMAFLLLVWIVVAEKEWVDDRLIGILLGILILTKHTIGIPILFLSMISTFQWKRGVLRGVFAMIPCGAFFLYLLCTHSLSSFFDLCFMGLFQFSNQNHLSFSSITFLSIVFFFFTLFWLFKEKKMEAFYLLGAFCFVIPIMDISHFVYLFVFFLFCLGDKIFSFPIPYTLLGILIFLGSLGMYYYLNISYYKDCNFLGKKPFAIQLVPSSYRKEFWNVLDVYQKYPNSYMIDFFSTKYDMVLNRPITYFDMLLTGNYGKEGTNRILSMIQESHDTYYIVTKSTYYNRDYISQMDYTIVDYFYQHYPKIEEGEYYDVFYKE